MQTQKKCLRSLLMSQRVGLYYSMSLFTSLILPMVYERVIEGWRRDLDLGSDELVFRLNPNVLVTAGVEPHNSAKLGLAPVLLPLVEIQPKITVKEKYRESSVQVDFNYYNHHKLFSRFQRKRNEKSHQTH